MKAVIVAAGMSRRLKSAIGNVPKCLVEIGEISLIERSIAYLHEHEIKDIIVVVGYNNEQIISKIGSKAKIAHNPWYATTNNMASLWFAKPFVDGEEFLYLHADLLYDSKLLTLCLDTTVSNNISNSSIAMLIEKKQCIEEDMKVIVDNMKRVTHVSKEIPLDEAFGEWTGIVRFSAQGGSRMFSAIEKLLYDGKFEVYDASAFNDLAHKGMEIAVVETQGLPWIEIDYPEDLKTARDEILQKMTSLNGRQ